jgi:hypothetical protein
MLIHLAAVQAPVSQFLLVSSWEESYRQSPGETKMTFQSLVVVDSSQSLDASRIWFVP